MRSDQIRFTGRGNGKSIDQREGYMKWMKRSGVEGEEKGEAHFGARRGDHSAREVHFAALRDHSLRGERMRQVHELRRHLIICAECSAHECTLHEYTRIPPYWISSVQRMYSILSD